METWLYTPCISVLGLPGIPASTAAPGIPWSGITGGKVGSVILPATHQEIISFLLAAELSELPR